MNTRHCHTVHHPNPPFQPTRVDVCRFSFWLLPRGRLNGVVRRKRARPMGCFGIVGKIDVSPLGRGKESVCATRHYQVWLEVSGSVLCSGSPLSRGRGASRFCMAASPGLP